MKKYLHKFMTIYFYLLPSCVTYDVNGNRKSYTLTYNGSQVYSANYAYDNLDRLTTVSYNDMDVSDISYNYDANNRVVSESTTDNTATYTYNSAGLVTNLVNSNGADFNYSYNVDGNQSAMQSNRGEWIFYEYDGLGQLISEDGMSEYVCHYKTYEYDTRGNRISSESEAAGGQFTVSEYTYDSTNRLLTRKDTVGTEETNTSFQYDNNGNLVQKIKESLTDATGATEELSLTQANADGDLTDDLVTIYTYNDFGELSGITTENNTISYLYDATGKRSLEIKNGNYGIMIWDGDYVVAETEKNNVKSASKPIANKYFRGHKLFANKSASGVGYYTYDAHGSVIGMSNESYVYDAFGNQITDTTSYNPFRYCGEYMEPDTGLIYLRNRYYDPSIGRFITEDPIKDGLNWYVYCGNNPVNRWDPLGLTTLLDVMRYANDNPDEAHAIFEKDPENYLKNIAKVCEPTTPVNIIEKESGTVIYTYVNVSGSGANSIISDMTYEEAAFIGIEKPWTGMHNGKPVISLAIQATSEPHVPIEICNAWGVSNVAEWFNHEKPGKVTMYIGDSRAERNYSFQEFYMTVGHEFGHVFGIADLYNDTKVINKIPSMMLSQFKVTGAQPVDYAMLFKAQETGEWQKWHKNIMLMLMYGNYN